MRQLVPMLPFLLSSLLGACSIEINLGEGATTGGVPDLPDLPELPEPPEFPETSTGGEDDGSLPVPPMDLPDDGGCDPLAPWSCPGGLECQPDLDDGAIEGFSCQDPDLGPKGAYAEPCACKFCCDEGLMCAPKTAVGPACTTATCCTPLCDLLAPDCPDPDQQCVPLPTVDDLTYAHLGSCRTSN